MKNLPKKNLIIGVSLLVLFIGAPYAIKAATADKVVKLSNTSQTIPGGSSTTAVGSSDASAGPQTAVVPTGGSDTTPTTKNSNTSAPVEEAVPTYSSPPVTTGSNTSTIPTSPTVIQSVPITNPVPTCTSNGGALSTATNNLIGAEGALNGYEQQIQTPGGVGAYGLTSSALESEEISQLTVLENNVTNAQRAYNAAEAAGDTC